MDARSVSSPINLTHAIFDKCCTALFGNIQQKGVEACPGAIVGSDARTTSPIDRSNAQIIGWRADGDGVQITGVQHIGVNAALHDHRGKIDPFRSQSLNQRFGNHPGAHVAPGWTILIEIARFYDIDGEGQADPFRQLQEKETGHGTGWTTTHNADTGLIFQLHVTQTPYGMNSALP
ncbi:MAG: hypothetical protein HQL50_12500 [Magnetococcales bacterium]|nr:hypothetical protein [Magnetococcales bacterium]